MTRARTSLIVVNALLLGVLGVVTLGPSAQAQGTPARARGQYLMLSGKSSGSSGHAVYLFDTVNQELIALRWNGQGQRLEPFGYRNTAADAAAAGRAR